MSLFFIEIYNYDGSKDEIEQAFYNDYNKKKFKKGNEK